MFSKLKSSRHIANQFSSSGIPALGDNEQEYYDNYVESVDSDYEFDDFANKSLGLRKSVDHANRLREENAKYSAHWHYIWHKIY